jgi:hypothetical protein
MSETQAIDWESRYRDGTTGWERRGLNPTFLAWRDAGTLAPCRILIPGCGRSLEPMALAEAGFDVTVVDAAPSAVATQQAYFQRLKLAARAEQADLFAWDPAAPFDAIYDQTCPCALPPGFGPATCGGCTVGCAGWNAVHSVHAERSAEWSAVPLRYGCHAPDVRSAAWTWPETNSGRSGIPPASRSSRP